MKVVHYTMSRSVMVSVFLFRGALMEALGSGSAPPIGVDQTELDNFSNVHHLPVDAVLNEFKSDDPRAFFDFVCARYQTSCSRYHLLPADATPHERLSAFKQFVRSKRNNDEEVRNLIAQSQNVGDDKVSSSSSGESIEKTGEEQAPQKESHLLTLSQKQNKNNEEGLTRKELQEFAKKHGVPEEDVIDAFCAKDENGTLQRLHPVGRLDPEELGEVYKTKFDNVFFARAILRDPWLKKMSDGEEGASRLLKYVMRRHNRPMPLDKAENIQRRKNFRSRDRPQMDTPSFRFPPGLLAPAETESDAPAETSLLSQRTRSVGTQTVRSEAACFVPGRYCYGSEIMTAAPMVRVAIPADTVFPFGYDLTTGCFVRDPVHAYWPNANFYPTW